METKSKTAKSKKKSIDIVKTTPRTKYNKSTSKLINQSHSVERNKKTPKRSMTPTRDLKKGTMNGEMYSSNNVVYKDNKINKKLELIHQQVEKSEEIVNNQQKLLSKIKEMSHRMNYLDKTFESIYYKNDVENFNNKLASNDENLMEILGDVKQFNKEIDSVKYLQEQNKNLKYKLDILEVEVSISLFRKKIRTSYSRTN
jgi:hypothetical protein